MYHYTKRLMKVVVLVFSLVLLLPSAIAGHYYYLKPGQSKTISVPDGLDTVFVSNPTSADYKVINNNQLIIYGRAEGYSDITLYDRNAKVLGKFSIEVDSILATAFTRIKSLYPTSNIKINKIVGNPSSDGAKNVYILTGTAPSEEAKDDIYQMIATIVGDDDTEYSTNVAESNNKLPFMTYKIYTNVINRIEIPRVNQINVRLTIVEVNKEFKDSLGIDWTNFAGGSNGTFSLVGFKGFDKGNIHNTIKALQNDKIAKILAQPNLTVLSGEAATFLVGGEVPITVRDGGGGDSGYHVEYKEYGVKLAIAAKVERANKIKLYLSNELSSVDGFYGSDEFSIPQFKTRKTSSTIEVADGDSFAIAGLLNEQDTESLSKIPFIGDIPIIGAFARNASVSRNKTELMVFATVNLVKPTNSMTNIDVPNFKKSSMSNLFFNVGVNQQARENRLSSNSQFSRESEVFLDRAGFAK